jgi:hypothetical protein
LNQLSQPIPPVPPEQPEFSAHELYERCVQAPARLARFLRALHGGAPLVLGEDFCGSAAVSRAWLALAPHARAIAIDRDAHALRRAATGAGAHAQRLELRELVLGREAAPRAPQLDVLWIGNFSLGELHERSTLLEYLRDARARLAPGGILSCDTFGGADAFAPGARVSEHYAPGGLRVRCTFERVAASALDGRVRAALHFRVDREGQVLADLPAAFEYDWRLWSPPELADALREAGFARVDWYAELPAEAEVERGIPAPLALASALPERWVVCAVARLD